VRHAASLSCQYCSMCVWYFPSVSWQINDYDDDDDDDDDKQLESKYDISCQIVAVAAFQEASVFTCSEP